MGSKVWVRYTDKALGSWSPASALIPISAQRPTCPALADLSPPGGRRSRPQGRGSWPDSPSFGGPTFHHPSPVETISTLHLMTHQTSWKITFPTNPFGFLCSTCFFSPLSSTFWKYFFCSDNSLFCPQAHPSVLPLYTSVTRPIFLYVFPIYHFIPFSYFSVSEGMGGSITIFLSSHPIFPM